MWVGILLVVANPEEYSKESQSSLKIQLSKRRYVMDTKFGTCVDCETGGIAECPLFICMDENGFVVVCCLVYVINNDLTILKCIDRPTDNEN